MISLRVWLGANWKWIIHALGSVAVLAVPLVTSGQPVDHRQLLNLGVLAAGTVGVYVYPNLEGSSAKYAKAVVAGLTAGLVALVNLTYWPPTTTEWVQVGVAAATALGVLAKSTTARRAVQDSGPGQLGDTTTTAPAN